MMEMTTEKTAGQFEYCPNACTPQIPHAADVLYALRATGEDHYFEMALANFRDYVANVMLVAAVVVHKLGAHRPYNHQQFERAIAQTIVDMTPEIAKELSPAYQEAIETLERIPRYAPMKELMLRVRGDLPFPERYALAGFSEIPYEKGKRWVPSLGDASFRLISDISRETPLILLEVLSGEFGQEHAAFADILLEMKGYDVLPAPLEYAPDFAVQFPQELLMGDIFFLTRDIQRDADGNLRVAHLFEKDELRYCTFEPLQTRWKKGARFAVVPNTTGVDLIKMYYGR